MSFASKIRSAAGITVLTAGLAGGGALLASQPAFASNNGVEVCAYDFSNNPSSPCMDAYNNGGTLIKTYAPGNSWEYIETEPTGVSGEWELYDFNTGRCIGDANNDPNDARAADNLVCPSQSSSPGWGTRFYTFGGSPCSSFGYQIFNRHWSGDAASGATNGQQWFLNVSPSSTTCYHSFT